jgi:hypothetical protein
MPKNARPFKRAGAWCDRDRLAVRRGSLPDRVAVKIGKKIHVLHAFQKKSKKGIETPKQRDWQKMSKTNTTKIEHEEGSGNVFADLGLDDADECNARPQVGIQVFPNKMEAQDRMWDEVVEFFDQKFESAKMR